MLAWKELGWVGLGWIQVSQYRLCGHIAIGPMALYGHELEPMLATISHLSRSHHRRPAPPTRMRVSLSSKEVNNANFVTYAYKFGMQQ